MKRFLQTLCMLAATAAAGPSFAAGVEDICPNGTIAIVRLNTIKATGSRAGFDQAVKDHMKWYRDHGFKDNEMQVANVLKYDPKSNQTSVSKTEVLSIHTNPPGPEKTGPLRDAAWDAYVAEYRTNSDIAHEHGVCLPKK